MLWDLPEIETYKNSIKFESDIYGSELFMLIKGNFCKVMEKNIPSIILNNKKNKHRILDNLFSHWYFWESYVNKSKLKHPLLLRGNFSNLSLKNILDDYYKNNEKMLDFEKILDVLDLETKFKKGNLLLEKSKDYKVNFSIIKSDLIKIYLETDMKKYTILFSRENGDKLLEKISERDFVRLIFRYYVLGSYNNQLAINKEKFKKINANLELFASGFNNYCEKYCSVFPDIEYKLGSVGRFQDIDIFEGVYEINPPFQTTMIYDVIDKIKVWIERANKSNKDLKFVLFLPNWINNSNNLIYSKYLVIDMLEKIEGEIVINNIKKEKFSYLDYWRDKEKSVTLPDTLNIEIKSKIN